MFQQFPYLWSSLLFAAFSGLAIWLAPDLRRSLVIAGLIGLLFGFFSFEFIPWYWDPDVIFHFVASPEDLLFSFATGSLTWLLACRLPGRRLLLNLSLKRVAARVLLFAAPGVVIAYSFGLTIMNHMPLQTTLIGVSAMGVVYLWLKREFWLSAVFASAGFCLLHAAILKFAFMVWPQFPDVWKAEIQPSFTILGIPPFEIFWALGYGLVFPLYLFMVFDARLAAVPEVAGRHNYNQGSAGQAE